MEMAEPSHPVCRCRFRRAIRHGAEKRTGRIDRRSTTLPVLGGQLAIITAAACRRANHDYDGKPRADVRQPSKGDLAGAAPRSCGRQHKGQLSRPSMKSPRRICCASAHQFHPEGPPGRTAIRRMIAPPAMHRQALNDLANSHPNMVRKADSVKNGQMDGHRVPETGKPCTSAVLLAPRFAPCQDEIGRSSGPGDGIAVVRSCGGSVRTQALRRWSRTPNQISCAYHAVFLPYAVAPRSRSRFRRDHAVDACSNISRGLRRIAMRRPTCLAGDDATWQPSDRQASVDRAIASACPRSRADAGYGAGARDRQHGSQRSAISSAVRLR